MELKGFLFPTGVGSIYSGESIQWNWKIIYGNRLSKDGPYESIQWNWKWARSSPHSPQGGEESIQWNWKPLAMPPKADSSMKIESIQWNWKSQWRRLGALLGTLRLNPFNGIERQTALARWNLRLEPESIQWNWKSPRPCRHRFAFSPRIHSMELKVWATAGVRAV